MSIGAIIWNNITQDLTQYGGRGRAACIRLAFVVGAATGSSLAFGIAEVGRWSVGYPTWFSGSLAGSQRFDSQFNQGF